MSLGFFSEKSVLLQNWQYLLISVFAIIITLRFFQRRQHCSTDLEKKHSKANVELHAEDDTEVLHENFNEDEDDDNYQPSLDEKAHISYNGATVTLPEGAQQFYLMANDRRSVRTYSKRPVSFETVKACVIAAGTAPSGAHTEPWTFCVVESAEMKQQIRNIVEAEEYLNYTQRMHRQWRADLKPFCTNYVKEYLTDAPYLILIFKQIYGSVGTNGRRKQHYYNEISVAIATGILLCALQAAGLSSLVTTPLNCGPALRALLGRPDNEKLLVLLPVGYAAEGCKVPDLQRKEISEIMVKF